MRQFANVHQPARQMANLKRKVEKWLLDKGALDVTFAQAAHRQQMWDLIADFPTYTVFCKVKRRPLTFDELVYYATHLSRRRTHEGRHYLLFVWYWHRVRPAIWTLPRSLDEIPPLPNARRRESLRPIRSPEIGLPPEPKEPKKDEGYGSVDEELRDRRRGETPGVSGRADP
jgi:hypothetical protein